MTTAICSLTEPAVMAAAAEIVAAEAGFWVGYSGEPVYGEDVAEHLDAARELLEKRGWSRTFGDPDPEVPEADESMSVKAMLLSLLRVARDWSADRGPLILSVAMGRVQGSAGDQDTAAVADRVMGALLRAYTGAPFVSHGAWVSKRGRAWGEVRDLLVAAAEFARGHGPR